jgi:hypothetical protein
MSHRRRAKDVRDDRWATFLACFGFFVAPSLLTLLTDRVGAVKALLGAVVVSGFATFVGARYLFDLLRRLVRRAGRRPFEDGVVIEDTTFPRKVLIATSGGRRDLEERQAGTTEALRMPLLRFLVARAEPDHVWVLTTSDTRTEDTLGGTELGGKLKDWFPGRQISCGIGIIPSNEFDMRAVLDVVHRAMQTAEVGPDDVVIDGTGGTSIMSVSALLAAQHEGIAYQAVRQDRSAASVLLPIDSDVDPATTTGDGHDR